MWQGTALSISTLSVLRAICFTAFGTWGIELSLSICAPVLVQTKRRVQEINVFVAVDFNTNK